MLTRFLDTKTHEDNFDDTPNTPGPVLNKTRPEEIKDKEKVVDVERLSKYFHPEFKGKGNNSLDYFSQLIKDIKLLNTEKEVGQLALMIHESKNVNSLMSNGFTEWYRIFCKCIGRNVTYKKSQLRNPKDSIKIIFSYIEPKK